jgi:rubrerythrin
MATFYSPSEVVALAVETEKAGQLYYGLAAQKTTAPRNRELLAFLADQEAEHQKAFAALYDKLEKAPAELPYNWDELVLYLQAITNSRFFLRADNAIALAGSAKDEREALDYAIQFEKETLLLYLEIERLVAEPFRAVVAGIAGQERQHIRLLAERRSGK